ncbi:MAG: long-chain fatty acid--CoA ligase, partial [Pseudolabrys sp.]
PGAPTVIETTRSEVGTLALRGRMVPTQSFPPAAERGQAQSASPNADYVDTGFACNVDRHARTLIVTAPPPGITAIGGYRFPLNDVDELVAQTDPGATIVTLPDADLGQRFAGSAPDRADLLAKLKARGVNPLISVAFQPRGSSEAA